MGGSASNREQRERDKARFDAANELNGLVRSWAPRALISVDLPAARNKAEKARKQADQQERALNHALGLHPGASHNDRWEARADWDETFRQLSIVIDQIGPLRGVLDRIVYRAGLPVHVGGGLSYTRSDDIKIIDEVERRMRESLVLRPTSEPAGDPLDAPSDAYVPPDELAENLRKTVLNVLPGIRAERARIMPDLGWLGPLNRARHRRSVDRLLKSGGPVSKMQSEIRQAIKRQATIFDGTNELRRKREAIEPADQRVRQVIDVWRVALITTNMSAEAVAARDRNLALLGLQHKTPEVVAVQVQRELTSGVHAQRLRSLEKDLAVIRRMGLDGR